MAEYYVYVYLDPTRVGRYCTSFATFLFKPFYVGKGKNARLFDHLKEARPTRQFKSSHKLNTIRKIQNSGLQPIIIKLSCSLSEELALMLEFALIHQLKSGCGLTNIRTDTWRTNLARAKSKRVYQKQTNRSDTITIFNKCFGEHVIIKKDLLPKYLEKHGESNIIVITGTKTRSGLSSSKARNGKTNGMSGRSSIRGNKWIVIDGEEILATDVTIASLSEANIAFTYGRKFQQKSGRRIIFEGETRGSYRTETDIGARPNNKYQFGLIWSSTKSTYMNHTQL